MFAFIFFDSNLKIQVFTFPDFQSTWVFRDFHAKLKPWILLLVLCVARSLSLFEVLLSSASRVNIHVQILLICNNTIVICVVSNCSAYFIIERVICIICSSTSNQSHSFQVILHLSLTHIRVNKGFEHLRLASHAMLIWNKMLHLLLIRIWRHYSFAFFFKGLTH